MEEQIETEYIMTEYVSNLIKEHQVNNVMRLRGKDATEEEKEELMDAESALNEDLGLITKIQKDLINYFKSEGCNCIDKYL